MANVGVLGVSRRKDADTETTGEALPPQAFKHLQPAGGPSSTKGREQPTPTSRLSSSRCGRASLFAPRSLLACLLTLCVYSCACVHSQASASTRGTAHARGHASTHHHQRTRAWQAPPTHCCHSLCPCPTVPSHPSPCCFTNSCCCVCACDSLLCSAAPQHPSTNLCPVASVAYGPNGLTA